MLPNTSKRTMSMNDLSQLIKIASNRENVVAPGRFWMIDPIVGVGGAKGDLLVEVEKVTESRVRFPYEGISMDQRPDDAFLGRLRQRTTEWRGSSRIFVEEIGQTLRYHTTSGERSDNRHEVILGCESGRF